jgi:hypothetical protein
VRYPLIVVGLCKILHPNFREFHSYDVA